MRILGLLMLLLPVLLNAALAPNTNSPLLTDVYVSTDGSDTNQGTLANPLKTIQRASEVLAENGTCYIRGGIYRETVNVIRDCQTFTNYNGEYVIVTGLDMLSNWTPYKSGIYQTRFKNYETQFTQLFANGVYQQMARYPNQTTGDMLSVSFESGYDVCTVYNGNEAETIRRVHFPKMPSRVDDFWKGGYFRGITGYKWMNPHGTIKASSGKYLTVNPVLKEWKNNSKQVQGDGHGFIFHLNALDTPGEWYAQDGRIYYMPPENQHPNELNMEAQKRQWAFRINGKAGVKIHGLHIKAASLELKASNCKIENCTFRYLFPYFTREGYGASFRQQGGIYVNGDNNTFTQCYIAHTWGNAVSLESGNGNHFENCILEDIGWNAQFTSSILTHATNTTIKKCTFGSTGRFHIRFRNKTDILYCDLYDCMKLGQDAGSIEATSGGAYASVVDIGGSEIAWNHLHDSNALAKDDHRKQFVVAIYLEDVANYTVHHNVVWNFKTDVFPDGAFVYLGPRRTRIYNVSYINNTVWNCDYRIRVWNRDNLGNIESTRFINNIFDGNMLDKQGGDDPLIPDIDFSNNIYSKDAGALFKDADVANFYLLENADAIDAGIEVPGITGDYTGSAPDAGAYEYGKSVWTPGATMEIPDFIEEIGVGTKVSNHGKNLDNDLNFHLYQNFPNPFNPFTDIKFQSPKSCQVRLKVYDVLGKEISALFNKNILPGHHIVRFNGEQLSSGIYFYQIQMGPYQETRKMVLTK